VFVYLTKKKEEEEEKKKGKREERNLNATVDFSFREKNISI
jgi:hypothetical protein